MKSATKSFTQHSKALEEDWRKIKGVFADTAEDVTDMAEDLYDNTVNTVKNKTSGIQESLTNYTEKQPLQALGYALLAGIVIGYWLKR
ncbi:MAG TPA: hypothetical protein VL360_02900 [Gammaproteobacteria bacterium]|jgi:hypothetical protein|nr:hypothetical protein [Gammaproteobacteria bacterium]